MEHPERAAVALGALDLELPGRKREQIGRNRLGLREAHADAVAGSVARDRSAPFATACQPRGTVSSSV